MSTFWTYYTRYIFFRHNGYLMLFVFRSSRSPKRPQTDRSRNTLVSSFGAKDARLRESTTPMHLLDYGRYRSYARA